MSNLKSKTSKMNRVAVCLYGQYRTGDWVLPRIQRQFAEIPNVHVDFFCSVKEYNYYERHQEFQDNNQPFSRKEADKQHVTQMLEEYLNPVAINFMQEPYYPRNQVSKFAVGFADSVFMKQQHELLNNFQYDMVFVTRYDVVVGPLMMPELLLDIFRDKDIHQVHSITNSAKEFIIADKCYDTYNFWKLPVITPIQDLMLMGTSLAFDLVSSELATLTVKTDHTDPMIKNIGDGHLMFPYAAKRAGVDIVNCQQLPDFGMWWTVVRPECDTSLDIFSADTYHHCFDIWQRGSTPPRVKVDVEPPAPLPKRKNWHVKFKSHYDWNANSFTQQILDFPEWNLMEDSVGKRFFDLLKRSYCEYIERFDHREDEHHKNIQMMLALQNMQPERFEETMLPDYYKDVSTTKLDHLTKIQNDDVFYIDRGSDKTIVVLNNHATWIDAVYGARQNKRELHYYNWIAGSPKFKNYNFVSINEDLSRVDENPLVYPSWYMGGFNAAYNTPQSICDLILQLFDKPSEYYLYSPCKNSMAACYVADLIGATRVFIEHGATTFIESDQVIEKLYYKDTEYLDLDVCFDNIEFMSLLREKYFVTKSWGIEKLQDIVTSNSKCQYMFYETTDEKSLGYMKHWADYVQDLEYDNLETTLVRHVSPMENQMNIRKAAISFFSRPE